MLGGNASHNHMHQNRPHSSNNLFLKFFELVLPFKTNFSQETLKLFRIGFNDFQTLRIWRNPNQIEDRFFGNRNDLVIDELALKSIIVDFLSLECLV